MNEPPTEVEILLREILRRVAQEGEYLTIEEVASRLKCKRETIANRMSAGIYREGVHYFRPEGRDKNGKLWHCDPLFKWSAVIAWVEGQERKQSQTEQPGSIPMRKGYSLRS